MASSDIALLLRRPGFGRYYAVVAAARASGSMFSVAGVLLVLQRTGSLTLAGLVAAAATLPGAVTGPLLGAWLDVAHSRRRLLVFDRLLTVVAIAALIVLAGHAPDWVLPFVGLAYGITSPLASGGFASVLPEVAGPGLLDVANTLEATSVNIAFIVGPALAGLVAGLAGPAAALELQIAVGIVLAVLIATDATFELRPARSSASPAGLRSAMSDGLRSLWRIALLRWNALTGMIYVAAWGTLTVGFPAYALSVGAGAHASGYLWAAISCGSLVSAFIFRTPALRLAPRVLVSVSFFAMAVSVSAWPLADGLLAALALVTLTGLLEGPSLVALMGVRQRLAPAHHRGQILSTLASLNLAAGALGTAAAGPLHAALGTAATLAAFGVLMAVAGVVALGTGGSRPGLRAADLGPSPLLPGQQAD